MKFNIPSKKNKKLRRIVALIEKDKRLEQMLKCANITAVDRLGYSDHGSTHSKIVANIALKILRILTSGGVVPSIVKNYEKNGMDMEDAEVVVVMASFIHDIGMVVHREKHDLYGITVARPVLERLLKSYPPEKLEIMASEILHAMTFHDTLVPPLTVEGGVVRIADGLDMAEGRARIPFEAGKKDIHGVSAMAIEDVNIAKGGANEKLVQIKISMSNSAGIFQVDELLKDKITGSGLAYYIHVTAEITGPEKGILGKIEF
ncbi:MAG: HD domain-containing protein [Candidatus Aenigmarchaeota archaeon]|nr:HD domain-containing protein [Candidatus Aenigmarchaeota archaeon]